MIESVVMHETSPLIEEVKELYEISFPVNERIPWRNLFTKWKDQGELLAYYEDSALIGMSYVFVFGDLCYLSYLAVNPSLRNRGYGKQLLECIKARYPKQRIVADIEEVKEPEYEMKKRRKEFYLRNGYESCSVFYHIFGVDYELISLRGKVTAEEWKTMTSGFWGKVPAKLLRFRK